MSLSKSNIKKGSFCWVKGTVHYFFGYKKIQQISKNLRNEMNLPPTVL